MKIRLLLLKILFILCALCTRELSAQRPNFLLIVTDDHGYGDVSTYHPSDVRTPHIDRLAAEGMLFTSMRANCTVCSPSRAALLTGLFPDRVGVPGVIRTHLDNSWGYFDPSVPTLASGLKAAGYHTAIVGKWHLGLESPNTPTERGFDFFHGFLGDMMDSYTTHLRHGNNYMRRNEDPIEPEGHATELFGDWAADYLRGRAQRREQPFFLYLAYNAPHFPIEPPPKWLARVRHAHPSWTQRELPTSLSWSILTTVSGAYWRRSRRPAWPRTRWWYLPLTTADHCHTGRVMIPGAAGSRVTTTAACACRSSCVGPIRFRQDLAATMRDCPSMSFRLSWSWQVPRLPVIWMP